MLKPLLAVYLFNIESISKDQKEISAPSQILKEKREKNKKAFVPLIFEQKTTFSHKN